MADAVADLLTVSVVATGQTNPIGPAKVVSISLSGTWEGTVKGQRKIAGTWRDIEGASWTANVETSLLVAVRPHLFRLDFTRTSGTLVVTIIADDQHAVVSVSSSSQNALLEELIAAITTGVATPLPSGDNNIGNVDIASSVSIKAIGDPVGTAVFVQPGSGAAFETRPPTKYVTVAMTANADAVDVGDVVADTQIVAACTPGNDIPAFLDSLLLIDVADQKAVLTCVFFSANTPLGTEDSAPDIDDTEMLTVLGSVEFLAADYIDLGGASYAQKKNIRLAVVPAAGADDIYMAIYTPATSTPNYGGGNITVRMGFSPN